MIVCCGEALMDMVPAEGRHKAGGGEDAFLARPGGCAFNTAIAAARLGAKVSFLGRIGTDFLGEALHEALSRNGVDTSHVARRDQPCTLAFVQRDSAGDAKYAFYSLGAADRSLETADLPPRLGGEAAFLVAGSISMLQEPIASTIEALISREKRRLLVSLDPNVRPSLIADRPGYLARMARWASMSAIVKASSEDLAWLYPEIPAADRAASFLEAGAELVVETRGEAGAIARTRRARAEAPAFKVAIADTIGAGDTFHAALLLKLEEARITTRAALAGLGEGSLLAMLEFAQAAAALCCSRVGAQSPSLAEVSLFLGERP
jgi:fructokinase